MSQTNKKVRDTAIDALKGFLVILVVLAHNGGSHPFFLEMCHPIAMGMFFMVSGYLIYGKLRLLKRLKGTVSPLLFFVIVSVIWRLGYTSFITHEPINWGEWGFQLLKGVDWGLNIPMWFLFSYLQVLVLIGLLYKIANNITRWLFSLSLMFMGLVMMKYDFNPLYFSRTLSYLPFFMLGGELHGISHRFPVGKYPFLTMIIICIIIGGRIIISPTDYYLRWTIDSFLACILSYFFYNLFKNDKFPSKLFAYYGRNSIVVLCVHILILDVVWRLWYSRFGMPDMSGALLQTALICALLYPCCEVYSRYIGPKLK